MIHLSDVGLSFVAFCLISSVVYTMNDLKDKKQDALNPYTKNRPIASGLITTGQAWLLAGVLTVFSFLISYCLGCLIFVVSYLLLNISYSYVFRRFFYIGVLSIATGFILRLDCAFYLLQMPFDYSPLLWIFFTSLFFTFIKRKLEFYVKNSSHADTLKNINGRILNRLILSAAALSCFFWAVCLFNYFPIIRFALILLLYLSVVLRLVYLSVGREHFFTDPIYFLKKDVCLKIFILAFLIALIF